MTIENHWIKELPVKTLVHKGANQTPALLVIHYSVTDTVADAVKSLNEQRLSYHILIEKDGAAFQTRRFTETAAHPGLSNWKARSGVTLGASVQRGSIGICLMNRGYAFKSTSPHAPGKLIYNPDEATMQEWEVYPQKQVDSCRAIAAEIAAAYPIAEVVGHHDIAIRGKFDPGPLFDLTALDALVTGQKPLGLRTTVSSAKLDLRRTPFPDAKVVRSLAKGDIVHVRSVAYGPRKDCIQPNPATRKRYLTRWASVAVGDTNAHAGFADMKHLAATPLAPALAQHL